jgi:hypothetical protein
MAARGRPQMMEDVPPPRKYTRVFKDVDGGGETWYYNLDKFPNGPYKVVIHESPNNESWEQINAKQRKTHRKYLNPANNKYVGYGRAKQLGLI